MTKDEALKLAQEALEEINKLSIGENAICLPAEIDTAMDAIKEALAQPEHEPVAWYRDEDGIRIYYETKCWDDATPLYTAPQRTWVGLTFDERIELAQDVDWAAGAYCEYAEKIEAKLKELNT